ncbi:bidirectional hydrogenase complex protein HoxE [Dictyobacter kobayashii]|uniref:Hydrogenase HoxE n=1 Tax=Dictyobacter kobayashii TaxID=2014872 RepID=A0A402APR8_9CHLR|nr:bidirectional hydrogenase complex protein HoxE [Dictyobacter kobayashii]GCE21163.1 hydrogenase HoxE [Dictyobacter kobayashii]
MKPSAPPLSADEKRRRMIIGTMRKNGYAPDALIETLHTVQNVYGYLDTDALRFVARELHVPTSQVYGVATFYHAFTLKPEGRHRCVLCQGTACYIKGGQAILNAVTKTYHIAPGETTEDGELSLLTARCLGACSMAPAAIMDENVVGYLTPERTLSALDGWTKS